MKRMNRNGRSRVLTRRIVRRASSESSPSIVIATEAATAASKDEVEQAPGHEDDFFRRPGDEPRDRAIGHSRLENEALTATVRDAHRAAHLAVHLNGDRYQVFGGERLI